MDAISPTALMRFKSLLSCVSLALVFGVFGSVFFGCGKAIPLSAESSLGPATIDGTGEVRNDGGNLGTIYPVTQIETGVSAAGVGITGWVMADLPFPNGSVFIGQPVTDKQTAFEFNFTYPPNNYQLGEAHFVIDTARDTSDTEGIFVDGIFTGRPPTVNGSTKVTQALYLGPGGSGINTYYIDWSLAHYKRLTRNTFDLNLVDLLTGTAPVVTPVSVLNDGYIPVVTGDDSPVYQAFLVMKGYTISKTPLTCSASANFTFENVFLHNDGNSVGAQAFTGTPVSPFTSWNKARVAGQSVEFFFDAQLPRVDVANITLAQAQIPLHMKRNTTGSAAVVINGVGVAEAGFDKNLGTAVVESWRVDAPALAAWTAFLGTIPATDSDTAVTLDLVALLGADVTRGLLAQGKLNVAFSGALDIAQGQAATVTRGFGVAVSGPELNLQGTYFTDICDVPNDPTSPLQDGAPPPSGLGDHDSPIVSSIQATEITSSTAVIQWLTDEGSTSQVAYGIGDPTTLGTLDSTLKTFHRVTLTGLQPYKYYYYQVRSADSNGNLTISGAKLFRTLR